MSRSKGTPNKVTREVRKTIQSILEKRVDRIPKLLDQLDPKDELEMMVKLIGYIVPKPIEKDGGGIEADADLWKERTAMFAAAVRDNS